MSIFDAVMVDIETLGIHPGCVIVSIGAIQFNSFGVQATFYTDVSIEDCLKAGLNIEPATLFWWQNQGLQLPQDGRLLNAALSYFAEWLDGAKFNTIWCNGASFDFPILAHAYHLFGMTKPWDFRQERCFRTISRLYGADLARSAPTHNALEDCYNQVFQFLQILPRISRE